MIGLLDPGLFLCRQPHDASILAQELQEILLLIRENSIELPNNLSYWNPFWKDLVLPFEKQLHPKNPASDSINQLRKSGKYIHLPELTADDIQKAWGFLLMFDHQGADWSGRMMHDAARALASQQKVVLLTRLWEGRNLRTHTVDHTTLREIVRWRIKLQRKDHAPEHIACVYHRRNLRTNLAWTTRLDWRLPEPTHQARYPFCPPLRWNQRAFQTWRVVQSKPAWVDAQDNAWARPNTPGDSQHWDVFIGAPDLQQRVGLSQVNVWEFHTRPDPERRPGNIHHIPSEKRSHFKDPSWSCP